MIIPILMFGSPLIGLVGLGLILFLLERRNGAQAAEISTASYFVINLAVGALCGLIGFDIGGDIFCERWPSNLCGLGGLVVGPVMFAVGSLAAALCWFFVGRN